MEFFNRGPQANPNGQSGNQSLNEVNINKPNNHLSKGFPGKSKFKSDWSHNKVSRVIQSVLSLCVLIVVVGLLVFLAISDTSNNSESKYIQTNKLQAVFLNTGQVYFGTIKSLDDSYMVLTNIFYLQTSGSSGSSTTTTTTASSSNSNVTLVKLGCEIHAPLDQMVINRASVTFWENLSPSGQVAKAVNTWEKDNPNGQKCSDQSTAGTAGQSIPQDASDNSSSTSK